MMRLHAIERSRKCQCRNVLWHAPCGFQPMGMELHLTSPRIGRVAFAVEDCILHLFLLSCAGFPATRRPLQAREGLPRVEMPVRALFLAAWMAVFMCVAPQAGHADDPSLAAAPSVPPPASAPMASDGGGSSRGLPDSVDAGVLARDGRAAYESAWQKRQAGDYVGAIAIAERALATLDRAL